MLVTAFQVSKPNHILKMKLYFRILPNVIQENVALDTSKHFVLLEVHPGELLSR